MRLEEFLSRIGLSEYERRVYLALLQLGPSKSRTISKKSNVSYGRIYEILEKLGQKSLVSIIPTVPKTFEAIAPQKSLKLFLRGKSQELESLEKEITNLKVPSLMPASIAKDDTIVLHGKQKQLAMIGEIYERSRKEILFIPGVYQPSASRHIFTVRALDRGIAIRAIIREITGKNKAIVKEEMKLGENVRQNRLVGLRIIIGDRKEAMLSIVDDKTKERISIYTTNTDFANSMAILFESLWGSSKRLDL